MYQYNAIVTSIWDADTFRMDVDVGFGIWTKNQPIRLYGVDAPELGTDAGRAAKAYLQELMPVGARVTLVTFKDAKEKYGRYLGRVTLTDGTDVAAALIAAGHAVSYFGGTR
jgi:micrococcal nuclease